MDLLSSVSQTTTPHLDSFIAFISCTAQSIVAVIHKTQIALNQLLVDRNMLKVNLKEEGEREFKKGKEKR